MKEFIAPLTAAGMVFAGGALLYLTIGVEDAQDVRLIIAGLMTGAATYLFGDAMQKRANDAQPTVTTTTGPPPTTTVRNDQEPN